MPIAAPPAVSAPTPASARAPDLRSRPEPVSVRAKGSGELQLTHRYPLRDLIYTADPTGRGMLTFEMGRGLLVLSGGDADQVASDRFVLHLDVLHIRAMAHVRGDCTLTLSEDQRIYRALACEGEIPASGEHFSVTWQGVETPAAPLR